MINHKHSMCSGVCDYGFHQTHCGFTQVWKLRQIHSYLSFPALRPPWSLPIPSLFPSTLLGTNGQCTLKLLKALFLHGGMVWLWESWLFQCVFPCWYLLLSSTGGSTYRCFEQCFPTMWVLFINQMKLCVWIPWMCKPYVISSLNPVVLCHDVAISWAFEECCGVFLRRCLIRLCKTRNLLSLLWFLWNSLKIYAQVKLSCRTFKLSWIHWSALGRFEPCWYGLYQTLFHLTSDIKHKNIIYTLINEWSSMTEVKWDIKIHKRTLRSANVNTFVVKYIWTKKQTSTHASILPQNS